ncbi:MAG: TetR/AcrR family transcriptional regulator, partial [Alphaproteobacteria bacterium]|nr:TetR/AcrR family transcriptional regulator [Alphaproteobacteria bacterium]
MTARATAGEAARRRPPSPRMVAKREATRERMVRAAEDLVAKGGFAAAGVIEIAQAASISTGALYLHFPDKDALAAEVFRRLSGREVEVVARAASRGDRAALRLAAGVRAFVRRAIAGPRQAYALIAEPASPAIEAERILARAAFARVFASVIDFGVGRKELPVQDPEVAAAGIIGTLTEALVRPLSPLSGMPPRLRQGLPASITAFCLRAVGARP